MKKVLITVGLLVFLYQISGRVAAEKVEEKEILKGAQMRIGHRCGQEPEATILACKRSAETKAADFLEMDVHLTKDQKLVVIHDGSVDRTTDGKGEVGSLTLKEIQALDAGYRVTRDGAFPFRGKGIRIQELSDFFTALPREKFYIEMKGKDPTIAAALASTIEAHKMQNQVIVASVNADYLEAFAKISPDIAQAGAFGPSFKWIMLSKFNLNWMMNMKANALAVPALKWVITENLIEAAHKQNIKVHIWTVNDPEAMKYWRDKGVDGIMTDEIDLLSQIVSSK